MLYYRYDKEHPKPYSSHTKDETRASVLSALPWLKSLPRKKTSYGKNPDPTNRRFPHLVAAKVA